MKELKDFMTDVVLELVDIVEAYVKSDKNVDRIYKALINHNYHNVVQLCRNGKYDAARKIVKNK